jgi:hypothetical protein
MSLRGAELRGIFSFAFVRAEARSIGSLLDLFNNPVGYRTSPCKMLRILLFSAEFVQKLQFLNNSIKANIVRCVYRGAARLYHSTSKNGTESQDIAVYSGTGFFFEQGVEVIFFNVEFQRKAF